MAVYSYKQKKSDLSIYLSNKKDVEYSRSIVKVGLTELYLSRGGNATNECLE